MAIKCRYSCEVNVRSKQHSFFKDPRQKTKLWWIVKQSVYGGSLNYRKVARPFSSKQLVHVVLKGNLSHGILFTRSTTFIERLLKFTAKRYAVGIKDFAINQDHLHLLVWASKREALTKFLRFFSAEMGRKYKAAYAKKGIRRTKPLWSHRPFTRLVSWGKRSVQVLRSYIKKNKDEALGFIAYTPRKHRLSEFLKRWDAQQASPSVSQLAALDTGLNSA